MAIAVLFRPLRCNILLICQFNYYTGDAVKYLKTIQIRRFVTLTPLEHPWIMQCAELFTQWLLWPFFVLQSFWLRPESIERPELFLVTNITALVAHIVLNYLFVIVWLRSRSLTSHLMTSLITHVFVIARHLIIVNDVIDRDTWLISFIFAKGNIIKLLSQFEARVRTLVHVLQHLQERTKFAFILGNVLGKLERLFSLDDKLAIVYLRLEIILEESEALIHSLCLLRFLKFYRLLIKMRLVATIQRWRLNEWITIERQTITHILTVVH